MPVIQIVSFTREVISFLRDGSPEEVSRKDADRRQYTEPLYRLLNRMIADAYHAARSKQEHAFPAIELDEVAARWGCEAEASRQMMNRQRARDEAEARKVAEKKAAEHKAKERHRVEMLRLQTEPDAKWWPIHESEVPAGVRFDAMNPGEIVVVSYGTFGRAEAGSIDPYKRVEDRGEGGKVTYYKNQKMS